MTLFTTEADAVTYLFRSMRRLRGQQRPPDDVGRDTTPTRHLIEREGLLNTRREYAVVTGSKGKGSTTAIAAKLLQYLGHRVGMVTSPHLVSWRERIRVNGRAIPEADFVRITSDLAPTIDAIEAALPEDRYFSPTGLFLALALRWFDEQQVTAAVLEVGRGGRFDDMALVPNKLSLFTPIVLEHAYWLGPTVERIAWHKAGIIKPYSRAYSVPQAPEVMQVLNTEAEARDAQFDWIAPMDMARYLGPAENGMRVRLGRYGELIVPLRGRYQLANMTLATLGAGDMHARLGGLPHASSEYAERIRAGLAAVRWPGRLQKLQDQPAVYLDGAINRESAQSVVDSLRDTWTLPVISIIGVPDDKDYAGVYAALGPVSSALILTDTPRNPILSFPPPETALAAARQHNPDVAYAAGLEAALEQARQRAGTDGTIVILGTQSLIADAALLWGLSYEEI
jgi:dihydrofolate synthase/folylpolyglutamate synthase